MNVLLLAAALTVPRYVPLVEIVSANNSTVTYRELVPLRVAMDPAAGAYHFKGCPLARSGMQWVSPAAAQLKNLKPHCESLQKDEYATHSVQRRPRDPSVVSVLFLGNSLTYFNEIPRLTAELAKREQRPIRADQVTKSGVSLDQLWFRSEALKKLWVEHWDYVVVQERGGRAPFERGPLFHQYLGMFADEVRRSGAQPLLYMTWLPARAAENEQLFRTAAARAKARLVPVGKAWAELVKEGSVLDADGSHPNSAGAYLVACTVFSVIYDKPPPPGSLDFRHLATSENSDQSLRTEIVGDVHGARIRAAAWRAVSALSR